MPFRRVPPKPKMAASKIERAQARVAAQAGCSLERALELMSDTAQAADESIEYVADEVLAGRLAFGGDADA